MTITEYTLPGMRVMPEGIVVGPGGDHFFSGSSADGAVYRCALDQETASVWLEPGSDGRESALGMALHGDARLVVCGGRTGAVFVYDLSSAELVGKETVSGFLNDVCVVGDIAYVTDSSRPVVWRYDLVAGGITEIDLGPAGPDAYLNGIVALPGENVALLVAAQGTETVWRLEISAATAGSGAVEAGAAELIAEEWGADGLLLDGDILYGVCNVGETHDDAVFFLGALRLSDNAHKAESLGRFMDPRFDTPTTMDTEGSRFLIVNAQFARGAGAGPPFQVIAVDLPVTFV